MVRRRRRADPPHGASAGRPVGLGARVHLLPAVARAGARPGGAGAAHGRRAPGLERGGARGGRRPRRGDAASRPRVGVGARGAHGRDDDGARPLRDRRGRRELVRARRGGHRLRRPGVRRALARRRPPAARHRGAVVHPPARPVVRSGAAAHAHAQRPPSPPLRVHAAPRRAAGGLRRRGPRVGAARALVRAGRRCARPPCGLRVPRPPGGHHARRPPPAGRRRRAHHAAVHGAGSVLRRP